MLTTLTVIIGLVFSIACAIVAKFFLDANKKQTFKSAVWLKGAAGLCFVLIGFMMTLFKTGPFAWRVLIGLVLGLIGDEVLAIRFLHPKTEAKYFAVGAVFFAIGHIFYIWALIGLGTKLFAKAAVIAVIGCALSWLYNKKKGSDAGALKGAAIGYIALVVVMCSVACSAAMSSFGLGTLLFALGGIGFVLSDNTLVAYNFSGDKRFALNIFLHIAYYSAQLFIAWSIAFI